MAIWEDANFVWFSKNFGRERINDFDVLDLIEAKFDAICPIAGCWENIDRIATNTEIAAFKSNIVAIILNFGKRTNKL